MGKRIALISEHASPLATIGGIDSGGQNVYVAQLAKYLAGAGHHVDVFTRKDDAALPDLVDWENGARVINVHAGPAEFVRKEELLPLMDEFTTNVVNFIRREGNYDLVHANFWMSGMTAAQIKNLFGTPFVITFHALGRVRRAHQGQADDFPAERFKIEEWLMQEADHIIAECPQDEEDLIRFYNADPGKMSIIPCGFDAAEFSAIDKAQAREYTGLPRDEFIVLQLGRMVARKGIDNVVRGFGRWLKHQDVPARLVIVGGDEDVPNPARTPEIGRLQKIAREEGVADRVLFAGRKPREELKYFYSAADVFVTTPWYEPFGMTPLEAMACGTPVIGANVGGIKYSVSDGETGYLVAPNQPDVLAERFDYLYANPKHLAILGQRARAHVNRNFTWRKITNQMLSLYDRVWGEAQAVSQIVKDQPLTVVREFHDAMETLQQAYSELREPLLETANLLINCFVGGGKVLVCGNGGSAAQAQHLAAELVGRFKLMRQGLPVLALNTDGAFLTAWGNDVAYDDVFARQVESFGQPGDVLIGLSTSGRSRNVLRAFEQARAKGMYCIALTGGNGGELNALADIVLTVPSSQTPHIQETHLVAIHILCDLVEQRMAVSQTLQAGVPLQLHWLGERPFENATAHNGDSTPPSRRGIVIPVNANGHRRFVNAGNTGR